MSQLTNEFTNDVSSLFKERAISKFKEKYNDELIRINDKIKHCIENNKNELSMNVCYKIDEYIFNFNNYSPRIWFSKFHDNDDIDYLKKYLEELNYRVEIKDIYKKYIWIFKKKVGFSFVISWDLNLSKSII